MPVGEIGKEVRMLRDKLDECTAVSLLITIYANRQ